MKLRELLERADSTLMIELVADDRDFICITKKESKGIDAYMDSEVLFWGVRRPLSREQIEIADIYVRLK